MNSSHALAPSLDRWVAAGLLSTLIAILAGTALARDTRSAVCLQDDTQALRSANRRHDVVSVLVTDERELELADSGLLMLEDAESGQQRLVDTASAGFRAQLKEQAAARIKGLESELRSSGIDLVRVDATRPVVDPLLRFFRMRERRRRR